MGVSYSLYWIIIGKSVEIKKRDIMIYFLDCEGFGIKPETLNTDINIFLLTLLLSSCLIYNGVDEIDNKSIRQLSYLLYTSLLPTTTFPIHLLYSTISANE